jgi:hypothetical protein
LKTILALVMKDLLRDLKHPWGVLILLSIPLLMTLLTASVFGGGGEENPAITVHLAVLDRDDGFVGGMLRSMSDREDASEARLQTQIVTTLEEGIALLERREVSALLVLPENMTSDLLEGATVEFEYYPNPAETILPQVVERGAQLLATGLSQASVLLEPELKEVSALIDDPDAASNWQIAMMLYRGMDRIERLEPYLFPPIVTFETVAAEDYIPTASREIEFGEKTP